MTDEDAFFVTETVEHDSNVNTNSTAESPSSEIRNEADEERKPNNLRDGKKSNLPVMSQNLAKTRMGKSVGKSFTMTC